MDLTFDDLFPRDDANRYRVYFRRGADLGVPVSTASLQGVGTIIETFDEDARAAGLRGVVDLGVLGVLDAVERRWIILPWEREPKGDPLAHV